MTDNPILAAIVFAVALGLCVWWYREDKRKNRCSRVHTLAAAILLSTLGLIAALFGIWWRYL